MPNDSSNESPHESGTPFEAPLDELDLVLTQFVETKNELKALDKRLPPLREKIEKLLRQNMMEVFTGTQAKVTIRPGREYDSADGKAIVSIAETWAQSKNPDVQTCGCTILSMVEKKTTPEQLIITPLRK